MQSARTRPDHSCTVACFWTRSVWPKPDQAIQTQIRASFVQYNPGFHCKNRTKSDVGSWIRRTRPSLILNVCMLAVSGRNQDVSESDLACSPGSSPTTATPATPPPPPPQQLNRLTHTVPHCVRQQCGNLESVYLPLCHAAKRSVAGNEGKVKTSL